MPESEAELAADSRWPALFPAPVCIVTTAAGEVTALEREVGASIVNRFPYTLALSFCRKPLSARHHSREKFLEVLERSGTVAVQFLPPGPTLDRVLSAISSIPEPRTAERLAKTGLSWRRGSSSTAPVFDDAYLVYEARLVKPGKDFDGEPIYPRPYVDIGSHRTYFLEIETIQLREDIARGRSQIHWRALPTWEPAERIGWRSPEPSSAASGPAYQKGYNPRYVFPSAGTVAFELDTVEHGMALKHLPPLPQDQVVVDNDRARWPCFFPSSAGMVTTWVDGDQPNLMPCGSTTILGRSPLTFAIAVSYARINIRYAPRASLEVIRRQGRYAVGVPYISDEMIAAIKYAGNISFDQDPLKISNSGLEVVRGVARSPLLPALPVTFDCRVSGELRLGTHVLFLGEVERIFVRTDVTPHRPLEWCPWADVAPAA
jgi:flavin reductase (DIM6/NTAB) family NADH-FMN oxidoreductase RutF